jgi:DNA primase
MAKRGHCAGSLLFSKNSGRCVSEKNPFAHHPCLGTLAWFSYAGLRRRKGAVDEDVERLKRRTPLLDYLRQRNWAGRPAGRCEFVGLCPLHEESQPSFYVNARKDVFYCHGCGQGGDLIRFVQLSRGLSFRQSLASLDPQITPEADTTAVLEEAAKFYQQQLDHSPDAISYLQRRGVHDLALLRELGIGYAPGGTLRRYLTAQGHSFDVLQRLGLINAHGADALYQRIVFPLQQGERIVNLYGRSIGSAFAHRFLSGSKGGLYAWEKVRNCSEVVLVEGLFDYVAVRQAGFSNATCSLGTHLNDIQLRQLCEGERTVYITFDVDQNQSGQQAADQLASRLVTRGISARRVLLPDGHDPNSFFVQGGDAHQFQSLLEAAQP